MLSEKHTLQYITSRLECYEPTIIAPMDFRQASVALIVRYQVNTLEVLFIQRATSKRDRWSGHIAFPGGRKEIYDATLKDAAIRETHEEVGLELTRKLMLGRLDDIKGRSNQQELPIIISCFVFQYAAENPLLLNYEVAEAFWMPIEKIIDPENHFTYETTYQTEPFPAINLGLCKQGKEKILWGLTYRFIKQFINLIDT